MNEISMVWCWELKEKVAQLVAQMQIQFQTQYAMYLFIKLSILLYKKSKTGEL